MSSDFDVVVAADLDWGIGKASGLPWPRLKGDLQHFKRVTSTVRDAGRKNAVVMGRATWESAEVAGRPLPNRVNVVVSRRALEVPAGVLVADTFDGAIAAAARADGVETTFVVGGGAIYRLALDHPALRWVYLTRVEGRFGCDTTIPDLDAAGFVVEETLGVLEDNNVRYRIERMARRASARAPSA